MTEQLSLIAQLEARMSQEAKDASDTMWDLIGEIVKELVNEVEDGPETTQGHYGNYMSALYDLKQLNVQKNTAIYLLLRAGANEQGVLNAAGLS